MTIPSGAGLPFPLGAIDVDDDLLALCDHVVDTERIRAFSLVVMVLDEDRRPVPVVLAIDDVPERPVAEETDGLFHVVRRALDEVAPDGSVVLALVRPGGGDRGSLEVAWARALTDAGRRAEIAVRAVVAVGRNRRRVLSPGLTVR